MRAGKRLAWHWSLWAALSAIATLPSTPIQAQSVTTGLIPLTEMRSSRYLGFSGGLYPFGKNTMPADHLNTGRRRALSVRPLTVQGRPNSRGKYVLLSLGMSNTTQEFCSPNGRLPCASWTFMGQAAADDSVEKRQLVIANGALGGRPVSSWNSPHDPDYDRVRETVLRPRGLSEKQVQVIWLKNANRGPRVPLPSLSADAYALVRGLADVVRAAKVRYPNLRQVFLSSRIFAGYATTNQNPEPFAYESGFAVKWLIEAQIRQMRSGRVDPVAGDLNYNTVAPWIGWGPYLWADGTTRRRDGLAWHRRDFERDGTHPSRSGEEKVGTLLLRFFRSSSVTRCWFLVSGNCS